jgi:hypothetical protein
MKLPATGKFTYEFVIFPLTWTPEEYVTQEDATITTSQLYKNDSWHLTWCPMTDASCTLQTRIQQRVTSCLINEYLNSIYSGFKFLGSFYLDANRNFYVNFVWFRINFRVYDNQHSILLLSVDNLHTRIIYFCYLIFLVESISKSIIVVV